MSTDQKPSSPVVPIRLGLDDEFRFRCHKGIACFNKCCENADVLLTPYDVLRLARRFGLTTREFIDRYTVDAELDPHGTPGLKLTRKNRARPRVRISRPKDAACTRTGRLPVATTRSVTWRC